MTDYGSNEVDDYIERGQARDAMMAWVKIVHPEVYRDLAPQLEAAHLAEFKAEDAGKPVDRARTTGLYRQAAALYLEQRGNAELTPVHARALDLEQARTWLMWTDTPALGAWVGAYQEGTADERVADEDALIDLHRAVTVGEDVPPGTAPAALMSFAAGCRERAWSRRDRNAVEGLARLVRQREPFGWQTQNDAAGRNAAAPRRATRTQMSPRGPAAGI